MTIAMTHTDLIRNLLGMEPNTRQTIEPGDVELLEAAGVPEGAAH